jgi:hypothetical protein
MAIHPLGLVDVAEGPSARCTVEASLRDLDRLGTDAWCGYSFACWPARPHVPGRVKAERALEIFSTAFTFAKQFSLQWRPVRQGY